MSYEVRRVPRSWQHPKDAQGYIPLHGRSYAREAALWDEGAAKFAKGLIRSPAARSDTNCWEPVPPAHAKGTFAEWAGQRPVPTEYMPDWPDEERTHLMMYETVSEGTPISPAFGTEEALARWLADNRSGSYAGWLARVKQGWAMTFVSTRETGVITGVEANALLRKPGGES